MKPVIGRHHFLLVTADRDAREIVGVLRLADMFEFVSDAMHECVAVEEFSMQAS